MRETKRGGRGNSKLQRKKECAAKGDMIQRRNGGSGAPAFELQNITTTIPTGDDAEAKSHNF